MKRSKVGTSFDSLSVRVAFLLEIDGGVVPTNEEVFSAVGQKSNVKALASSSRYTLRSRKKRQESMFRFQETLRLAHSEAALVGGDGEWTKVRTTETKNSHGETRRDADNSRIANFTLQPGMDIPGGFIVESVEAVFAIRGFDFESNHAILVKHRGIRSGGKSTPVANVTKIKPRTVPELSHL
ncbi:hypothetical protein WN48_05283 [Eufriesea mexicana]|uniref:Uncharacterized protein n=1 Tax=Eufriesea mexicana TaxID=516756 RepID=A0A310SKI8_9HYME|nr:hypothetical protein WN48_05283 [Eufriesea mexicana]